MTAIDTLSRRFSGERLGISLVFLLAGLWFASWAGRLSVINHVFDFTGTGLGALLACMTAGTLLGLGLAPILIRKIPTRPLLTQLPLALAAGLVVLGAVVSLMHTPELAYLTLFATGVAFGILDVTMNVCGANVERRMQHSILPSLHGFFSLGTLLGAGFATLTISLHWDTYWHFGIIALFMCGLTLWAVRLVQHDARLEPEDASPSGRSTTRHPRGLLLMLGLMVAGLSFTEGAANDWLTVATNIGHGLPHSTGALVFTFFVGAMTIGRFGGGHVVDRLGAVRALLLMGSIGLAGVALFILGSSAVLISLGAALWGLGSSLGFPVGMSIAAARSRCLGPRAVSIISAFGYGAMLSGPPLIGILADQVTVLNALWLPAAVLLASLLITPVAGAETSNPSPRSAASSAP